MKTNFLKKSLTALLSLSMAFTALTLCFNYAVDASWVVEENWGALIDTTPYMVTYMFWCTLASIVLNGITLFKK